MVCFNSLPIVKQSVDALLATVSPGTSVVLVDNHSADSAVSGYLATFRGRDGVRVLDPGRNIGCARGYELAISALSRDWEVVFKVDDDTISEAVGFDRTIAEFVQKQPRAAFCCAYLRGLIDRDIIEPVVETAVAGVFKRITLANFSLVAWTRKTYSLFGRLRPPTEVGYEMLYGLEDFNYQKKAMEGKFGQYVCMSTPAYHQGNEHRPVEYVLWKWYYGYLRGTRLPYEEFVKDRSALTSGFKTWVTHENGWFRQEAQKFFSDGRK